MRLLILFTSLLISQDLLAASWRPEPFVIPGVGVAEARITETGKKRTPYKIDLWFTCEDHRSIPNSVQPKPQLILQNLEVFYFYWKPVFNRDQQMMTISYSLLEKDDEGVKAGTDHKAMDFKLNQTCEVWQR